MDISSFNVLLILNNILPLSVGLTGVKQVKKCVFDFFKEQNWFTKNVL